MSHPDRFRIRSHADAIEAPGLTSHLLHSIRQVATHPSVCGQDQGSNALVCPGFGVGQTPRTPAQRLPNLPGLDHRQVPQMRL